MSDDEETGAERKIVDAYAEWDDPDAFRVFLMYDNDDTEPVEAEYWHFGEWTLNQRLFYAMVRDNPKDFVGRPADREIGWLKEPPAKRAAKAVNKELARIAKGEPPPDLQTVNMGLQIAEMMSKKSRR